MTILLLESVHEAAQALLEGFDRVVASGSDEEASHVAHAEPVAAILTRGRGRITRTLMEACPELRVVARCGAGLDNVDVGAARELGIPVVYAPGGNASTVAEHTLMLILAASRRLLPIANAVRSGRWDVRNRYEGVELRGKTLGVIGLGAIGRRVAALGEAFDMRVVYWSRASSDPRYQFLALDALLREADIISVHVALTPETRRLIGTRELALMKPGAILVNTARGAVIDQRALAEALEQGQIGAFAADVLDPQPPDPVEFLLRSDRALLTPHIASLTDVTYRQVCVRTATNVLAILRGESPEPQSVYR